MAPDYPGFGHSDCAAAGEFAYTFDHLASVMGHFTEALGPDRYTLYMQDYGGPVGFRLALATRSGSRRSIVQNAVAHNEGLGPNCGRPGGRSGPTARPTRPRCGEPASLADHADAARGQRPQPRAVRPGPVDRRVRLPEPARQTDIQTDLFYDYRTNVESYPKWQAWMQKTQPRLLVLWGKYEHRSS